MLSVSGNYSQNIVADSRNMPYRVTLGGAIVLDRSKVTNMTLNESVSSSSGVSLGTSNSATLSFTIRDAEALEYSGMLVEPESGLLLPDGTIEYVPLGKFWVTDFSTNNDYKTLTLNCADGMYHLTGEYVSELTYPAFLKAVMSEIVAKTGVEFISDLPDITIRRKPEGLTYRDTIGYLAGCCGKNARFNRLGQLEFVWYTDTGITIGREIQYLDGLTKLNDKPLSVNFEVTGQKEMYAVTVVSDGNGGITATPCVNIFENDTVVLSINPFSGYELADITAVTEAGENVTLYMDSEGGRTFIQPDSNVIVTASFRKVDATSFDLTVRSNGNGGINYGLSEAGTKQFAEGETVSIFAYPDDGYEVESFLTTPSGITLTPAGTITSGGFVYEFTMPKSDVTVTVNYKIAPVYYNILGMVDDTEFSNPGYLYVEDTITGEFPLRKATEGTTVSVTYSPNAGYALDYFDSNVELTQVGTNTYNFIMPAEDVSIVVHYKLSEDESKAGLYSWLRHPDAAPAPTTKPYWAVFYKESATLPTCQKFYLIRFDSWKATGYDVVNDKRMYAIQFDGYYYCGSKNVGNSNHQWDSSNWSGNGASGSTLEWDAYLGSAWADWDAYYGPSSRYCLLASNIHLFHRDSLIFEKCENAIQTPQINYLSNGMDVREKGSLTDWKCPDTFSTPLPSSDWMILKPDSGFYMTVGEDGKYDTPLSNYPNSLIVLFYDKITITNLGAIFSDALVNPTDEEFYLATPTNGKWAYLVEKDSEWGELHDLPEGAVFGLRSPLITTEPTSGSADGNLYNFAGILVSNLLLRDTSGRFMYNNACRICDCASSTSGVSTFSLRRSASETVNATYTNPLIYEKMVDSISELVQGVTYTPAKVKYRGNPAFQAGDVVSVPDKNGTVHTILIMQQTMTFGGGMNAEISCPGQTEQTTQFSANGPITTQIKKEVQQSSLDLERRLSANNSLVYAAIYKTISLTESKVSSVVEWQTEKSATIANLEQTANEQSAKISLVVGQNGIVNESGAVQGSVVIEAINGESSAKISADRLDIEGKTLNIKVDAANITGTLNANQINANGITLGEGTVGGWTITPNYIGKTVTYDSGMVSSSSAVRPSLVHDGKSSYLRFISGQGDVIKGRATETVKVSVNSGGYFQTYLDVLEMAATSIEYSLLTLTFKTDTGITHSLTEENLFGAYRDKLVTRMSPTRLRVMGVVQTLPNGDAISAGTLTVQFSYNTSYPRFSVLEDGSTYMAACQIEANASGLITKYADKNGNIVGEVLINSDNNFEINPVDRSIVMGLDSSTFSHLLKGTWWCNGSLINSSDRNVKNTINSIDDKYEVLFDSLRPVTYKYNAGTSDRLHIGFIAQEVDEAIEKAGLTRQDFAAVCISNEGTDKESWGVRYEEFVALNTSEIQKLKKKISELERKIGE